MKIKRKRLWLITITALSQFVLSIGGCKDDNAEVIGVSLLVIVINPANLAAGVPLNQAITVAFNEAMN